MKMRTLISTERAKSVGGVVTGGGGEAYKLLVRSQRPKR